jgi:hypothetical protein
MFAAIAVALALTVPPLLTLAMSTMGFATAGLGAATAATVLSSGLLFAGFSILTSRSGNLAASDPSAQFRDKVAQAGIEKVSDLTLPAPAQQAAPADSLNSAKATTSTSFRQRLDADRLASRTADLGI